MGVKVILSLTLLVEVVCLAAALKQPSANELLQDPLRALYKSGSLTNILNELASRAPESSSLKLNRALQLTRDSNLTAIITEIQSNIDNTLTTAIDNIYDALPNIVNQTTTIQATVSSVLTVVNVVAEVPLVQAVEPVYIVVLVAQAVLTIANNTLGDAEKIAYTAISSLTITQTIADKIFEIILTIL